MNRDEKVMHGSNGIESHNCIIDHSRKDLKHSDLENEEKRLLQSFETHELDVYKNQSHHQDEVDSAKKTLENDENNQSDARLLNRSKDHDAGENDQEEENNKELLLGGTFGRPEQRDELLKREREGKGETHININDHHKEQSANAEGETSNPFKWDNQDNLAKLVSHHC